MALTSLFMVALMVLSVFESFSNLPMIESTNKHHKYKRKHVRHLHKKPFEDLNYDSFFYSNLEVKTNKITLLVLGPKDLLPIQEDYQMLKLDRVVPSVVSAVNTLSVRETLPNWRFEVIYRDTNCSSVAGPLAAMEARAEADVIFGPICDYVVSPVAKYSAVWNLPLLTSAALGDPFGMRDAYFSTLIRLMGSFNQSAQSVQNSMREFKWERFGVLYSEHDSKLGIGHSACYFLLDAVYRNMNPYPTDVKVFHRKLLTGDNDTIIDKHLNYLGQNARIILLCGSQVIVRRIMLAADDLGMTSSGEYVFVNIDFFRQGSLNQPWYSADDQNNNSRAQKAYESLLILSSFIPETDEYMKFSKDVRYIAQSQYNYTYPDGPINPFVAAFYEAVMLYAVALNETIEAGGTKKDTAKIVAQMKNRTFPGISGDVRMDANGDRVSHYTLLDMNQSTGNFEVVANYNGTTKKLEFLPSKSIHWAGGRKEPPADTPLCGFDGSKCPKRMSDAAIVAIVGSVVITIVIFAAGLLYRKRQNWETHESVPLSASCNLKSSSRKITLSFIAFTISDK